MWTNNATVGKVLYAQTTGTAKYNYIAAQALVRGMTGFATSYEESNIVSNESAQYSPRAQLNIPDNVSRMAHPALFPAR